MVCLAIVRSFTVSPLPGWGASPRCISAELPSDSTKVGKSTGGRPARDLASGAVLASGPLASGAAGRGRRGGRGGGRCRRLAAPGAGVSPAVRERPPIRHREPARRVPAVDLSPDDMGQD